MSAASKVSPDLKVFSKALPVFRLRHFTRVNAWPLPGFTYSFSMIEHGLLSSMTLRPGLKSFVE